jgi:tetratricopeptide (TPR) repeat protein
MKNIASFFILLLFLSSCGGNKKARVEKLNIPEMKIVDSIEKAKKDTVDKEGLKNRLKISKPLTKEEKNRKAALKHAHTAFKLGKEAYDKGDYETAIEKFRECLAYDPENSIAGYNLGKIYFDQKQPELALSYFEDAIKANPRDSASMVAAGLIFFEKKDYDKAKEMYDKAVAIAPTYGKVYFHRGTLFGVYKKYEESKRDLLKAVKYEPGNSEAYVNLGLAYFYLKNMDSACIVWKKAAAMGNPKGKQAVQAYCGTKKGKK